MSKPRTSAPRSREIISRQLRQIIRDGGLSSYALGRESGVDQGVIQRFLNEERDIKLDTLDRLADVLHLRLVESGRPAKAKASRRPRPAADRSPRPLLETAQEDGLPPASE